MESEDAPDIPDPRPGETAMQASDPNHPLRIRAAWIYYVEGRTQMEVAELLGISRVQVTRLLAESRRRGEVSIRIISPLTDLVGLERALEARFGLSRAVVAPLHDPAADPTWVIAAAAGAYVSEIVTPGMTVGVGWGRTLHGMLPHVRGRALDRLRVISLLGGIMQARRFNPAEFAWRFAELFGGEGFLVPAPALVDSPGTRAALLEQCGIDGIFAMTAAMDLALLSAGGISRGTTAFRVGHLSEADRRSLREAGAVGDVLYNFIDEAGRVVDHPVNRRVISAGIDRLRRVPQKVLVSGGADKTAVLRGALRMLEPTVLITDEHSARALAEG